MSGGRIGRGVGVLGPLLGLAACVTAPEYAEIGSKTGLAATPYGYRNRPNPDGGHLITVVAPSGDLAHVWWDRRAQTLCAGDRVEKTIYSARRPTVTYENYGGRPGDFHLDGLAVCVTPEGAAPAAAVSPQEGTPPLSDPPTGSAADGATG